MILLLHPIGRPTIGILSPFFGFGGFGFLSLSLSGFAIHHFISAGHAFAE
jgi:hypothetical protein